MNGLLKDFFLKPLIFRFGAILLLCASIVLLLWQLLYVPAQDELSQIQQELSTSRSNLSLYKKEARQKGKSEEELKQLETVLFEIENDFSDDDEITQILSIVSEKANGVGLNVTEMKPTAEKTADKYIEMPISINLKGSFDQIAIFFDEVGSLNQVMNIDNFEFNTDSIGDENALIDASMTVSAFRFLRDKDSD